MWVSGEGVWDFTEFMYFCMYVCIVPKYLPRANCTWMNFP